MPRPGSNKWRNQKRGTYAIVGAFALVIPFILLSYFVFGQHHHASPTLQLVSIETTKVIVRHSFNVRRREEFVGHVQTPSTGFKVELKYVDDTESEEEISRLHWQLRRVKESERLIRFEEDYPDCSPFAIAEGIISDRHKSDSVSSGQCFCDCPLTIILTVVKTKTFCNKIFRHGDRTPTQFYPNDPYKDPKFWPDGLGALTKEGKLRAYNLGRIFRKRYDGFISEKYFPEDVYVFSSDHDRCLMTAQLFLAGFFPPVSEQIWNKDINWQPIPVHTVPRSLDKLITVKKPCPRYEKELNQTYNSNYFAKINSENAELYKYLTQHSGMVISNIAQLEALYNTLEVEVQNNLKLPDWAEKVYDQKLKNLAALGLAAFTFTDTTKRLKGGPLLGEIVKQKSQKVLGNLKPNRKLYLYSAHDLTMISVLRALGFEELFKPDYGASVIFELHQPSDGGDHIVELLYLNNTHHTDPMRMKIPGCDEMCKLKDFLQLTKPFIPENWEAECEAN